MSDAIKALEALRDAWLRGMPTPTLEMALEVALAALRAEQPALARCDEHRENIATCYGVTTRSRIYACDSCCTHADGLCTPCGSVVAKAGDSLVLFGDGHVEVVRAEHPAHRMEDRCDRCRCTRRAHSDIGCENCGCRGWREPDQPAPAKACAGFVSRDWMTDEDEPTCGRPHCGKPKSAHQPSEQPARKHCTCAFDGVPGEYPCAVHGEQPAPKVEVPPMPTPVKWRRASHNDSGGIDYLYEATEELCSMSEVRALHAAAVALAERCETLQADFANAMREATAARRAQGEAEGKLAASEMAGVVEGWKERCERADAWSEHWREQFLTTQAERDEARAELAEAQRLLGISRGVETRLLAGLDEALNATKRLRAQLAEAQAKLRDARMQERERIIATIRLRGYDDSGTLLAAIRALPEEEAK